MEINPAPPSLPSPSLPSFTFGFFSLAPLEIEARGEKAQLAYQSALKDGAVNVYRGRVLLIGQDRAGKTSLKKSLIGLPMMKPLFKCHKILVHYSTNWGH